jgi:predicted DNA-binding transcriptional regulator AlpA
MTDQLAEKIDQLLQLYGNMPLTPPKSERDRIKENIQSGEGFSSIKELCLYHNVCPATIYNWISRSSLPEPIKIGGSVRFKNSDLLAMELSQ